MIGRSLFFALALLLSLRVACLAQTEKAPRVEIEDYGLYDASLDPVERTAGKIVLLKKTWRAPAEAGALFGLRFSLKGPDARPATVTVRVTHPAVEDPGTGRKVQHYETQRELLPSVPSFAGQRLDKDALAAAGRWVFQVRQGDAVLAEREFEVYAPDAAKPDIRPATERGAGFVAKEHGLCRGLNPTTLRGLFPGRTLVPEQSFALRAPLLGECCFLTLADGASSDAHALVTPQGQVLARFEPWAMGKTKAVSFEELNGDGLPEIVILTEPRDEGLPNRVYWSLAYGRAASWAAHELVDRDLAKLRRASEIFERLEERLRAGRKP